jgi:hypothetical protein
MEGISDAQRYRQIQPAEVQKKDDRDKDQENKGQAVSGEAQEAPVGTKEIKAEAKTQGQYQEPESPREVGAAAPEAGAEGGIPAGGDGTVYINKGGSKITDAKAVVAIAEICASHNKTDLKADELQKELAAKGIESYVTTVDGKPALKFANGDVFVDSSGNHALGLEDGDFNKALAQIEQKYGLNLDALEMKVAAIVEKRYAEHDNKELDPALLAGLNGLNGLDGLGQDGMGGPEGAAGAQDIGKIFEQLDTQLQDNGYKGPMSEELYEKGDLEKTCYDHGITMPEIPDPQAKPARGNAMANDLFNAALLISTLKQPNQNQPTFTA